MHALLDALDFLPSLLPGDAFTDVELGVSSGFATDIASGVVGSDAFDRTLRSGDKDRDSADGLSSGFDVNETEIEMDRAPSLSDALQPVIHAMLQLEEITVALDLAKVSEIQPLMDGFKMKKAYANMPSGRAFGELMTEQLRWQLCQSTRGSSSGSGSGSGSDSDGMWRAWLRETRPHLEEKEIE
jgi:hypothetical protein